MNKNENKNKLIPELRFPEFKNENEWVKKTLGNICVVTNGRSNVQDHIENGKYPMFDRSETIKASNDFIFDCEAVIIPGEGMRFIPKYYFGKFNLHQRAYALKDFTTNGQFVYYSMLHKCNLLSHQAVRSTVLSLRLPILQKFPLQIPENIQEQQKISSCLSSLDEVISAHKQKLDALEAHKKGLLQNLFPQEGETVPKYRFSEFKNDGDWVEKKLGDKDVSFFVNQKITIKQLKLNTYISTENMLPEFSGIRVINKLPSNGSFTKFIKGDILISNIRPYLKKVWKADIDGAASNDVLVFRAGKEVLSEFLEYIIKNDSFINYVMKSAKGVKMPRGDKNAMQEYSIFVPLKKEQQKIATCLSSLDDLITAQIKKIKQLKLHKKGLMQVLFPKI